MFILISLIGLEILGDRHRCTLHKNVGHGGGGEAKSIMGVRNFTNETS
jgi:hypothetical protein